MRKFIFIAGEIIEREIICSFTVLFNERACNSCITRRLREKQKFLGHGSYLLTDSRDWHAAVLFPFGSIMPSRVIT